MRQVLFRIPLDSDWCLGPLCVPGFGFGVVLALWLIVGGIGLWMYFRRNAAARSTTELAIQVAIWGAAAAAIVMLPTWVHLSTDRQLADAQAALQKETFGSRSYLTEHDRRDRAWRKRRLFRQAVDAYESEIQSQERWPLAYARQAWILATAPDESVRDGRRAVERAETARELSGGEVNCHDSKVLDALAAAYAEAGRFDDAVKTAQRAASFAPPAGIEENDPGELSGIRRRMQRYRNGEAYRDLNAGKSLPLYGYGFMMFVGFVAAGWTAMRRGRMVGIPNETIWDVCLWVLVGGIGGARLWFVLQYHDRVFEDAHSLGGYLFALINLREGGLVLYGGIVMALTAFLLFCRKRKLNPLLMTDVVIPSFFVGLAFGRLGCFMNGCCYGDRCTLPWAVSFPLGSVPDMALVSRGYLDRWQAGTLALHPSQLYSSLNAVALALLTHFYFRVRRRDGAVLALALLTYPVTRFLIEYLRGDEPGRFGTSLTISQWGSLAILTSGIAYTLWLSRRPRRITPVRIPAPEKSPAPAAA